MMAFTAARLEKLRDKFGGVNESEIYDEKFRKVASHIFSAEGTRTAPYAGISTLLAAPSLSPSREVLDELQVALVGVPMDLGVSNRNGSRFGPRALRSIERIGPYNHVLEVAPTHQMRVADIGDVPFRSRFSLENSHVDIENHIRKIVECGTFPLSVGGDHSITFPILKAVGRNEPVGMIHIDAHCDTGGSFDGTKFHHGGPFRNAVLAGVLDPTRVIQIGIRGSSEYLWEFSYESGMTVVHAEEVSQRGISTIVENARRIVGDMPTYISFDIDSIDPSFAPGTGTPEIGGLTTREALEILRGLKGVNVVGGDVVEVAPQYDPTSNTAQVGAQILFEILSLMISSPSLKR